MSAWAVVMTKPNCEAIAVTNLKQQGFDCYVPRFKQVTPNKPTLIKPLFPRYIFTLIDSFWYCIRGTRGVSHVLLGENGPAQVPDAVIDRIKEREGVDGFIQLEGRPEKFRKGESVKAIEGPLVGKLLIYEGMTAHERVKVLISMLGRQVPVTIDEKNLRAA